MTASPRVSFVLPAYKRAFLREAIASVLAQDFRDFELVVVDDASPENLKEVVDAFEDPRLAYRRNSENLGSRSLVRAWNHAMTYARGEWCVLASDDDVYDPRYLSRMLELSARYPACDLFHCRVAKIDGDGRWFRIGDERIEFETQVEMVHARGVLGLQQTMPDFMFRRAALERIGGFVDFPLAWYSDDATWFLLAKNGVACAPEVLFQFRISGLNISGRIDNVRAKFRAAREFQSWARRLCAQLKPTSRTDEILLENLAEKVFWKVEETFGQELARLPLGQRIAFRILRRLGRLSS